MESAEKPQVVVITGASAGVGRATARAFGARGAKVGLIARGIDGLEGAKRDVEEAGGEAFIVVADVADAELVDAAAASIESRFGPIDVWVNNAMVSVFSPVKEMTAADYKRVTEVTYLGYVYGTLAALRTMLPRDAGAIVQVGSALAHRSIPLQSAYCAAKHAAMGFTESLWTELLHDDSKVRLSMIQMPALNTPQFGWVKSRLPRRPQPVPPIFQPEVAADAIVWASQHEKRELYVGFPSVKAIEAEKIAPSVVDSYLAKHGYDSQQTDEPVRPDRRDNLWDPVPGDHGAHGTFDDRAIVQSDELWLRTHRGLVGAAALAACAGGLALAFGRRRPRSWWS